MKFCKRCKRVKVPRELIDYGLCSKCGDIVGLNTDDLRRTAAISKRQMKPRPNADPRRVLLRGAGKSAKGIRTFLSILGKEKDASVFCKTAVELRREASRLESIARKLTTKPGGLCEAQGCFEMAVAVHRVESPNVSSAAPARVSLCQRHSSLSRFPLLMEFVDEGQS